MVSLSEKLMSIVKSIRENYACAEGSHDHDHECKGKCKGKGKHERYLGEAEDDEDEKHDEDEDEGEDEGGEDEGGEDEGGSVVGDDDLSSGGDDDASGMDEIPDIDGIEDEIPGEGEGEEGAYEGEDEGGEEPEFPSEESSPEELNAEEPPEHEPEEGLGDEADRESPFDEYITNQLVDFPVEDVSFDQEDDAVYVDAKFGDKAVSFCLYKGDEGQPLLAVLYKEEVHRIELPTEAVGKEGKVRDEFMPLDWMRGILAQIVDVAPEFESYRMSRDGSGKSVPIRKSLSTLGERVASTGKAVKGNAIHPKKTKTVKKMSKNQVAGAKKKTPAKTANLGRKKPLF